MEYTCCYQRCKGYKVGIRWQSQVFIQHENGGWEGIVMWQKGACLLCAITFAIEVDKMTMEAALDHTLWQKMLQSSNQILVQNGMKVWHHFFTFNFSTIFEEVSYLEEGSWAVGGFFPFLKPVFQKGS